MRRLILAILLVLGAMVVSPIAQATVLQGPVVNPANGHKYGNQRER